MDVAKAYKALGGEFVTSPMALKKRLESIKALVFDWDGVFNAGAKGEDFPSSFNEPDSMGINLFRYFLWKQAKSTLPITGIITGADNPTAKYFAEREHLHFVFSSYKDKRLALDEFCSMHGFQPSEVCFFFDDVLDFSVAELVGLRIMIRREGSLLTQKYAAEHGLVDYYTGLHGDSGAIREAIEMMLGLSNAFEGVVDGRVALSPEYLQYWSDRQAVKTTFKSLQT